MLAFSHLSLMLLFLGSQAVGDAEEPSSHELRQIEPLPALLLREGNYAKGTSRRLTIMIIMMCPNGLTHALKHHNLRFSPIFKKRYKSVSSVDLQAYLFFNMRNKSSRL